MAESRTPKQIAADKLDELIEKLEKAEGRDRQILDRLDISGNCWVWDGNADGKGRGRVWRNGKIMLHHRAVWEILVGPIPGGGILCHHCDNPRCANPLHIYVGTHASNMADMRRRKRYFAATQPERFRELARTLGKSNNWSARESNPKAKLSEQDVAVIKASPMGSRALARQFSVDRTTIQRIRRGALWA